MSTPKRSANPMRPTKLHPEWWWCDEHGKWHGNCKRKDGTTCHGDPHKGLPKCRMHAGKRSEQLRAESEAITAWNALGGSPDISHTEVVLAMLQMSWLRVHLYASLLQRQVQEDGGQPELGDGAGDADAGTGTSGLIGHTYSGVKDIGIFATGEAVRGLVVLESQERDRAVRFAKTAHDMGVADAVVDVLRRNADRLELFTRLVVEKLGHSWSDPAVVRVIDEALLELPEGGEAT